LQEINPHPRKKRKLGHEVAPEQRPKRGDPSPSPVVSASTRAVTKPVSDLPTGVKGGESIDALRKMILGELDGQYTDHQKQYVTN
jgi:hypothetical protein